MPDSTVGAVLNSASGEAQTQVIIFLLELIVLLAQIRIKLKITDNDFFAVR